MHFHIAGIAAFAALTFLASVESQSYPRLEFRRRNGTISVLGNNSFIDRAFIHEVTGGVLSCVSNSPDCCSGNWVDNQGRIVPARESHANFSFFTTTAGVVNGRSVYSIKYRQSGHIAVGVFRCDIPDLFRVMKSLYVYIGSNTIGEGTLRSMRMSYKRHPRYRYDYQIPQFILSCVSEGGPVTTVQWWRNGVPVTEDRNHVVTQNILDTSQNAVYDNKLTVWGREGGTYRCRISNNIPKFYLDLTYLSYNSSSMLIEVADRPRNVEHIRDSPTSFIIYWDTPSTTPDGYLIFYNLTGDHVHSIRVNASGDSQRQTYELMGLSEGNYSISMVALSRHLPSSLVGSPILYVADMTPSVAATTSTTESVAGSSYVLTCTVTIKPGLLAIPDIVWNGHGIGMTGVAVGRTISRDDGVHTRDVTLRPLLLTHGGTYTCTSTFSLNGVTSRDGSDQTILTVLIPPPSMIVRLVGDAIPHIGNNVSVECLVELDEAVSYSEVELEMRWLTDGRRSNIASAAVLTSPDTMRSSISFIFLSESDSGDYTCEAILTPRDLRVNSPSLTTPYIFNLTAIVPNIVMETSPSIIRILDVPPYNSFLLSCTIWAEVEGVKIPLPMTVDWIKRVETPDNVRFSPATPDEEAELRPDPVDGYHSVLRSSETNSEGDTVYRCRAVFVRDRGGAMGRQTSDSLVAVVGPIAPVLPLSIKAIASNNTSVMIQWEASSIAYTPETYHVEYGTNNVYFDSRSPGQESGPDIRVLNKIYSQALTSLAPGVIYYYRVVATNSAGSTASAVRSVRTTEVLLIEPSGVPQVGESYSLRCSIIDDTNENYTILMWTHSDGSVLNSDDSGFQSSLELEFGNLQLSDVGKYTCSVTFLSGNSRQVSHNIQATVPPPQVQLTELDRPDHGILYSGLNLTLRCSVNVSELGAGFVIVSVHWLKDGASLRDCSQLKRESDTLYYCQLTLTHLSHISSSGSYSCRAVLTPKTDYPLLKSRSSTSDNINLNIAIPRVTATMSISSGRLLDIPPYNKFEASCLSSVSVPGLVGNTILQTQWEWSKRGVGEENFNRVPSYTINSTSLWSSIHIEETRSGSVTYQCLFSIEGVDNILTTDQLTTSVIGTSAPWTPEEVRVTQLSTDGLVVEWIVQSITYTPETYLVEYGTSNGSLVPSGDSLTSGDDIEMVDKTYHIELKDLNPGTKYYYIVVARNSARTSRSQPQSIYTKETAPKKVAYVIASRLNDTTLSIGWGEVESANGNLTHYEVWINSSVYDNGRHLEEIDGHYRVSISRSLIVSGLERNTEYVVYVAAVNGAGRGEWQQTQNAVTTQGLERVDSGGDVGLAVGVTLLIIFIIILVIVAVILLFFCIRRRGNQRHKGLVIREEMRASGLLNHIIVKEKEETEEEEEDTMSSRYSGLNRRDGTEGRRRGASDEGEVGDDGELGYETEGASGGKFEGADTTMTDSDEDTSSKGKTSTTPGTDSNNDEHTVV